jgi:hypothetical protein
VRDIATATAVFADKLAEAAERYAHADARASARFGGQ